VPPGVDDGSILRHRGGGEAAPRNGTPGDLNVYIRVSPHPLFRRSGIDIYCQVPINFSLAALGGEIEVPTLDGPRKLKIPPGTQSGQRFRMHGVGVHNLHGPGRGDQHIEITVETPTRLSRKQRKLFSSLAESLTDKNRPITGAFKEKFLEFLHRHQIGSEEKK